MVKSVTFGKRLFDSSQKGALIEPIRLNKVIREQISECIAKDKRLTCDMEESEFEKFMSSMNWLEHKLNKGVILHNSMTKLIASGLVDFINRNCDEYPDAMQWVFNVTNSYYSLIELNNR